MIHPHASDIEIAIILFAAIAPGFAMVYLLVYLMVHRQKRRRRRAVELSLLDIIGDLPAR